MQAQVGVRAAQVVVAVFMNARPGPSRSRRAETIRNGKCRNACCQSGSCRQGSRCTGRPLPGASSEGASSAEIKATPLQSPS